MTGTLHVSQSPGGPYHVTFLPDGSRDRYFRQCADRAELDACLTALGLPPGVAQAAASVPASGGRKNSQMNGCTVTPEQLDAAGLQFSPPAQIAHVDTAPPPTVDRTKGLGPRARDLPKK